MKKKNTENRESTCGNCQYAVANAGGFVSVVHCQQTGNIIPHQADFSKAEVVLFRVPLDCPRSDTEVVKSKDQAKRSEWVKVNLFDLQARFSKGARHAG